MSLLQFKKQSLTDKSLQRAFLEDNLSLDKRYLAFVYIAYSFISAALVLVEQYRHPEEALLIRFRLAGTMLYGFMYGFLRFAVITSKDLQRLSTFTIVATALLFIAQDYQVTVMYPLFFFNSIAALMFFTYTLSALTFLRALWVHAILLFLYFGYAYIDVANPYHLRQGFNIIYHSVFIIAVGYVVRSVRVKAFLQTRAIEESRRLLAEKHHELEGLNAFKGRLLSLLAHDVKAPLHNLQLALQLREDMTTAEQLEVQKGVEEQLRSTTLFIEDLLAWSKTQLSSFEPNVEVVNVYECVYYVAHLFDRHIKEKSQKLILEVDENIHVYGDKDMFCIVLRNLLSNAIKFTAREKKIIIRTQNCSADYVAIEVEDEGRGLTEAQHTQLFAPIMKSQLGTEDETGTGLGLRLSYDFAHQNNGHLSAKPNAKGAGTIFTLYLPRHANAQPWEKSCY